MPTLILATEPSATSSSPLIGASRDVHGPSRYSLHGVLPRALGEWGLRPTGLESVKRCTDLQVSLLAAFSHDLAINHRNRQIVSGTCRNEKSIHRVPPPRSWVDALSLWHSPWLSEPTTGPSVRYYQPFPSSPHRGGHAVDAYLSQRSFTEYDQMVRNSVNGCVNPRRRPRFP